MSQNVTLTKRKKIRTSTREVEKGGEIFVYGEYIRTLRLTSELVDLRVEYTNSILLRRVKFALHSFDQKKKQKDNRKDCLVWRYCSDEQYFCTCSWRVNSPIASFEMRTPFCYAE